MAQNSQRVQNPPVDMDLIQQGLDIGIPANHHEIGYYQERKTQGELWEAKAKELMSVENVHFQQLDALAS